MEIPDHILDRVLNKLHTSLDVLQFTTTCATWNSVYKEAELSLKHQVPKLLVRSDEETTCNVYDVVSEKYTRAKISVPPNTRFCGSSLGWLVYVNKDFTVTLQKACFRAEDAIIRDSDIDDFIRLPSILELDYPDRAVFEELDYNECPSDHYIVRAVVSAHPISNRKDCVVVVIYGEFYDLAFFRLAIDKSWNKIKDHNLFQDILYHNKNRFYAVTRFNELIAFHIPPKGSRNDVVVSSITRQSDLYEHRVNRYLVHNSRKGEIWLVRRDFVYHADYDGSFTPRETLSFQVYRLDAVAGEWIEITSLGEDVSLFVGDTSSVCVLASRSFGCQPNCIHFAHDADKVAQWDFDKVSDLGIYDMGSKEFRLHFGLDSNFLKPMYKQPPVWFVQMPNV